MTRLFTVVTLATLISTAALLHGAWAQVPNPCPPNAATTGTASANEPAKKQGVEHSAILPDAPGTDPSAAPTVKKDGKSVEAQTECPKPPNQLNRGKGPS
jgi:hypothetical protein